MEQDADNRGIDQNLFEIISNGWDSQLCHKSMGLRVTYLGQNSAGMSMVPNPELTTGKGRLHGGVIATMADAVMGAAAATMGHVYRTAEMKLNYIAPAFDNAELLAEAHVIHPGKTIAVVEGSLFNTEGKLVAKSMGTYFRDNKMLPPDVYASTS